MLLKGGLWDLLGLYSILGKIDMCTRLRISFQGLIYIQICSYEVSEAMYKILYDTLIYFGKKNAFVI